MILLVVSTVWLGLIGFLDDYIKVFRKNKEGLAGRFKIAGQIGIGLIVGLTLYFNDDVVIREVNRDTVSGQEVVAQVNGEEAIPFKYKDVKSTKTTIPFAKNNEFDYGILPFIPNSLTWAVYVLVVILIITAVSNGANITDGIDGLAAGVSGIIGLTLAILAYVSGRIDFSSYLNIMYIPHLSELVIFCTAFVGACLGFLWYNAYPCLLYTSDAADE